MVGCFSTAMLTASSLYGLPVTRLGTELMLERLSPFQNSNRIPITLVDALIPDLASLAELDKGKGSRTKPTWTRWSWPLATPCSRCGWRRGTLRHRRSSPTITSATLATSNDAG